MRDNFHEPHPTSFARKHSLSLRNSFSPDELKERTDEFLSKLVHSLQNEGCKLIGHIKGMFDAGDRGRLFFNLTSFNTKPRYKGRISGEIGETMLTINIIIYGVEEKTVEYIYVRALEKAFQIKESTPTSGIGLHEKNI